jgi:hypothetical protein
VPVRYRISQRHKVVMSPKLKTRFFDRLSINEDVNHTDSELSASWLDERAQADVPIDTLSTACGRALAGC